MKATSTTHPLILTSPKSCGASPPPKSSTLATSAILILGLLIAEHSGRYLLNNLQHLHPILEDETNRFILARHIFVDTLSCFVCAGLGWANRHVMVTKLLKAVWKKDATAFPAAAAESRGYAYDPGAYYLSIYFLAYQMKNMVDTIVWNDGAEYVFHHVLSLTVCWTALYPGFAITYATFFFGLSEVSTGILCILANFDDDHGVVGLGDAFPVLKMVIGVVFVVGFIICRAILWPLLSYYYTLDALACLKNKETSQGRRWVIKLHMSCLVGLSALQLSWLVLIFFIAQKEFAAMGLI